MADRFTLEESFTARTNKVYKIEFEQAPVEDDHLQFLFTCTQPDGAAFVFKASISPVLVEKLGIDATSDAKKLMKCTAGQGLIDLKTRLNAGHDTNFEGLPYIKTYTLRDKPKLEQYL